MKAFKVHPDRVRTSLVLDAVKTDERDLGTLTLPETITVPDAARSPSVFGSIAEPFIRRRFTTTLLAGRTRHKGTGGHRHGADILWHELAALYDELASELGDPRFHELAVTFELLGESQGYGVASR